VWYVYIVREADGHFYTGMTQKNPDELLAEHQRGKHSKYTSARRLVRIDWMEKQPNSIDAGKRERQIKRWSHAKKQALIDGDFAKLKQLAKSRRSASQS
jgi:predicted GIY-YIG superfamily endonuclease